MAATSPLANEAQISADEALARRLQAEPQRTDPSTPLLTSLWGAVRGQSGSINQVGQDAEGMDDGQSAAAASEAARFLQIQRTEVLGRDSQRELPGRIGVADGGMTRQYSERVRVNVADEGFRGINASRLGLLLLSMVNLPLIIAGIAVLTTHWRDHDVCDGPHRQRWRWWALISVVRMLLITPVIAVRWKLEGQQEGQRNIALDHLSGHMRNSLDIVGLVWFVIGNIWLLQNTNCSNASESPIYQLCLVYIIITYIHICLPCIMLMLLVPVICFCLPCVIRLLSLLQVPQRQKGARQEEIEKLPLVKYSELGDAEASESCAICLADWTDTDELRKLPCSHAFHRKCVDTWLVLNANCPVCRARCFEVREGEEEEKSPDSTASGDALV